MTQRRWPRGLVAAWAFSGLGSWALLSAGCQSDTRGEIQQEQGAEDREPASAASTLKPRLYYEPELDYFYATVQEPGQDPRLEEGYALLFYDHDLVGALEHFLKAPAREPEQKLSRAVGSGRTLWTLGRWFRLVGEFQAEANLAYLAALEESVRRGLKKPPEEAEYFVAGRSALYLGRKAEAQGLLEKVSAPAAEPWKAAASGAAELDKALLRRPIEDVLAGQGVEAAIAALKEVDWKTSTDGRFWDPYTFEAAARVCLEAARQRFQEAATLGAELSPKLEPNVLDGIRFHLALSCFEVGQAACVSGLGPGQPGQRLGMLVQASANRAQGKGTTLEQLAPAASSLQAGLLAAHLADASSLEQRIEAAEAGIEWGENQLRPANGQLWPFALQEAIRVVALLRQRQAAGAGSQAERMEVLSAAIDRLREAQPEALANKNEPLFVMQFALAALQRSGCSDFAFASGMLHEKLKQRHVELYGPTWTLGGINAAHCIDVITPAGG
jgi:hypothetical protein